MRGVIILLFFISSVFSQKNYFELLEHSPADKVRLASGSPGPEYWQQQVDYKMEVELDENKKSLSGSSLITYHNNSPHELTYLWLQLDQNRFKKDSESRLISTGSNLSSGEYSFHHFKKEKFQNELGGGIKLITATDIKGQKLSTTIVGTLMRVDLSKSLKSGEKYEFKLSWNLNLPDAKIIFSRSGYEYFEKDKNSIFTIAQWYPRLAAYSDKYGWHTQQFLWAEFALEFGDFEVKITVPEDHIVSATGELQNADEVLSKEEFLRLEKARTSEKPLIVVSKDEVEQKIKKKALTKKSWIFKAQNVRDFAFASSRRFIWDAMNCKVGKKNVLCMSFYPPEADSLWSRYSSQAVSHALKVYSKYAVDYPYPVAQSINGPVYGMEYPMVAFQSMRPEKDGTYSRSQKYRLISVIIHEVGHNFFPMIINNDERRFAWMDEGLNSFLQYLAETEWEDNYHGISGKSYNGVKAYMSSTSDQPIMTKPDNIRSLGNNAYGKPSAALVVLRETILGRKIFDFAFKEYCRRWKFKRPMPADFFRTIEEVSGRDLSWFWKSWFYGTEHVDIALEGIEEFSIDSQDPNLEKAFQLKEALKYKLPITEILNKSLDKKIDEFSELKDFYNTFDPYAVTDKDKKKFADYIKKLDNEEKALLESGKIFYVVKFNNIGGVPMPLILTLEYEDDSKEVLKIPASFWRQGKKKLSKLLILDKRLMAVEHDVLDETLDTNRHNNRYPPVIEKRRVKLTKDKKVSKNPMQTLKESKKKDKKK